MIGDNDFCVEHTGVTVRQRAETLGRMVTYYQEAFAKAFLFCFCFCPTLFRPWKRGLIRPFGGQLFFFGHSCVQGGACKKKRRRASPKKTPKILKKVLPTASDTTTATGLCNHKDLYLWHKGIMITKDS